MTTSFPKSSDGIAPGMSAPCSMPRPKPAASGRRSLEVADLFSTQPQPQVITTISVMRSSNRRIFTGGRALGAAASGGCILRGGFVSRVEGADGEFIANGKPPAKPAHGIADRANLAGFGGIAGLHGNEIDAVAGVQEANDHFRFNFEVTRGHRQALPGMEIY